jgi:signal transduction histidine kinase
MTNTRAPSRIIPRAFPGITPAEVEELISNSKINSYPAGAILCRENQVEHTFYMILEGVVEVSKQISPEEVRLLKTLEAGEFFGEMALIHNSPRAATVEAKTALVVLELDKGGFEHVLQHSSSVAMAMVRVISNRLRQNDDMAIEDLRMRAGELAQAYQKLAEQDLARREFLSDIAHELRTPLMAASGYLQILNQGKLSGTNLNEALDAVSRNVGQIVSLVNDVLFLQEIELVLQDFQPVDMSEIAHAVVEKYSDKAKEHHVPLTIKGDKGLPQVAGDPKLLERALTGIIDNAIKFSPRGGDVELRFSSKNDSLALMVEDHGIGIAPEIRPRIFERFYHLGQSGEDLFSGLGIGLAITRQIIEQHNGKLELESTPGRGSTFTMVLPKWGHKN